MNPIVTFLLVFACIFGAALAGMLLRYVLPEHHLGSDTKDTVKLAMGLVATMAALVLGLLVASAKSTYDTESNGVTQMAAKIIFLDRMLANFGPETKETRERLRGLVERVEQRMWPDKVNAQPSWIECIAQRNVLRGNRKTGAQKRVANIVEVIESAAFELGQMRWLEFEQADSAISAPLLYILTIWLAILFISFGLFSPLNGTVIASLMLAALSVAGAIYLIIELNSPFSGLMQISNSPFVSALAHLGQ